MGRPRDELAREFEIAVDASTRMWEESMAEGRRLLASAGERSGGPFHSACFDGLLDEAADAADLLRQALSGVEFAEAHLSLERLRARKTQEELQPTASELWSIQRPR
jgi:hypothetical protein